MKKVGYYKSFKCKQCGKDKTVWVAPYESTLRTYELCSQRCSALWRYHDKAPRPTLTCQHCSKGFQDLSHGGKPRKYCSHACAAAGRKSLRHYTCQKCGKDFAKPPTGKAIFKFCSNECKWKAQGDGLTREWGSNWISQRNAARRRDQNACQVCGKYTKTVHHIKARRHFIGHMEDANILSNLITLCQAHHVRIERGLLPCPTPKS